MESGGKTLFRQFPRTFFNPVKGSWNYFFFMSKSWPYLSAILGLSRLSRVPDVMFKACVAAWGWPCSRNVLLAFLFLSLHMNVIVPNSLVFQCVLCRFFPCQNSTSVILSPSILRGAKRSPTEVIHLRVFACKDKCKLVKTEDYS